jgi:hypothetical protein
VLAQSLPPSAEAYGAEQRSEIAAAVSAARRLWRRMGADFDLSYALIERQLLEVADRAQSRVAVGAQAYIPAVLAETGQSRAVTARFEVDALSLVGTAGDGLSTDGLLYGAVTHAKVRVGAGAPVSEALVSGGKWLTTAMSTLLSDTGRSSERLATMARPVTGWVRMLEPPSCGRCVVLAGKRVSTSTPFRRHPKCDCRHIPTSESIAGEFTVDARSYFDSLDEAGQIKLMGSKANAAAVRDFDADINQIVNAYRKGGDVRPAQIYGRDIKYSTEGTTRRGLAYTRMSQMRGSQTAIDRSQTAIRITRTGPEIRTIERTVQRAPRLMPESIAQIATDRADQERLLRLYGWLL